MCYGEYSPVDPRCPIAHRLRPWECNAIPDEGLGLCRLPREHWKWDGSTRDNVKHFFMDWEPAIEQLMGNADLEAIKRIRGSS